MLRGNHYGKKSGLYYGILLDFEAERVEYVRTSQNIAASKMANLTGESPVLVIDHSAR